MKPNIISLALVFSLALTAGRAWTAPKSAGLRSSPTPGITPVPTPFPNIEAELSGPREYYEAKRYSKSIEGLDLLLIAHPAHPAILYRLGLSYAQVGRIEEALAAWEAALVSDPEMGAARLDLVRARYNRGKFYFREKKYEQAMDEFAKALEAEPHDSKSHYYLGQLYAQKSNWIRTINEYEKARKGLSGSATLWNSLGVAYSKNHQYDEARSAFKKSLELDPNSQKAKNNLRKLKKLGY